MRPFLVNTKSSARYKHEWKASPSASLKPEITSVGLSDAGNRGPVKVESLTDEAINEALQVEVTSESCNMIRLINEQLLKLHGEGIVKLAAYGV